MLDTDATPEDIKARYRKLSTLVHPDKRLDMPLARDAFEVTDCQHSTILCTTYVMLYYTQAIMLSRCASISGHALYGSIYLL
jgi:hypothetical protein